MTASIDRPGPLDVVDALRAFREAGVLAAADVHTAAVLARLADERNPTVVLAAALAMRAPRLSHVCVDLATVAASIVPDVLVTEADGRVELGAAAVASLPWPEPSTWVAAMSRSALVVGAVAPLVLEGSRLYLERYHEYERLVAAELLRRAAVPIAPIAPAAAVLDALLGDDGSDDQRAAVAAALGSALTVLVGGPGTGKTTTVAALLASLVDPASGVDGGVRIALAAPTGKAAARLGVAFRAAAQLLEPALAERLVAADASTIHRLLGSQRRSASRFRHDRGHPLPHDVVIIDETSMVSLPMMAKLLDAVRPDARLVLVGDPGQLASVEAGSVLADVAGPLADVDDAPASAAFAGAPLGRAVSVLRRSRRFPPGSPIDRFARAIRRGDADAAIAILRPSDPVFADPMFADPVSADPMRAGAGVAALAWVPHPADASEPGAQVRALVTDAAVEVAACAAAGDAAGALARLEQVRILCAHRRGPFGVERWNARLEAWLAAAGCLTAGWYPGRPVLVTANDYRLGLYNGDLGVVVSTDAGPRVAFEDAGSVPRLVAPVRLESVETVHAMTIHKSQGSEFDHVVVVLPPAGSRLATRELLYTAVTRARSRVTIVGDEPALRAAVQERIIRASGLRDALWPR